MNSRELCPTNLFMRGVRCHGVPSAKCPQCATIVTYAAGFHPVCPQCGFAGTVATPPTPPVQVLSPPVPAPINRPASANNQALAIVALILNILVIPGLGTLIGGRTNEGLAQIGLVIVGFVLIFTIVLIPISVLAFIAAWIWGIVSGVRLITATNAPPTAAAT